MSSVSSIHDHHRVDSSSIHLSQIQYLQEYIELMEHTLTHLQSTVSHNKVIMCDASTQTEPPTRRILLTDTTMVDTPILMRKCSSLFE
jgi:hypothetical protein